MKPIYSMVVYTGGVGHAMYGELEELRSQREAFWRDMGNRRFMFRGHTKYVDMKLIEAEVVREEVSAIVITHVEE